MANLQDTDCSMSNSSSSPRSYFESPHSSPMQFVPQLTNNLNSLSCSDDRTYQDISFSCPNGKPFLRILEQPSAYFRFRYASEMAGTHGCILGKSSDTTKTYPQVELVNFKGPALIRCCLAQCKSDDVHPHQLRVGEDETGSDVVAHVDSDSGYAVAFRGMGIIHTAKKDLKDKYKNMNRVSANELSMMAKEINLNIVRLKFSAHDMKTNKEICEPVFSEEIRNLKSAETNNLKLCRTSLAAGDVHGGQDLFLLVEKVTKNNIQVHFVELNDVGDVVWTTQATFGQNDVHHQYAIVVKTPAYPNKEIEKPVTVFVELYRPKDKKTSNRIAFVYNPSKTGKMNKKRKADSYSSIGSSDNSLKSSELPQPVQYMNLNSMGGYTITTPTTVTIKAVTPPTGTDLGSSLMDYHNTRPSEPYIKGHDAMLSKISIPEVELNSEEFKRLLSPIKDQYMNTSEVQMFFQQTSFKDYFPSNDEFDLPEFNSIVADSGKGQPRQSADTSSSEGVAIKKEEEYTACYTSKDGLEVKKLVREICDLVRGKKCSQLDVGEKIEQLMSYRLSNGDTFLHMTLSNNIKPSFQYVVRMIRNLGLKSLLSIRNDRGRGLLHLAVELSMVEQIPFLVEHGCDPMLRDLEGNNALHYAVKYNQNCLEPLLNAISKYKVPCDLDAKNNDVQSPLHLSCVLVSGTEENKNGAGKATGPVRALLKAGASPRVADKDGRRALHLAVYSGLVDNVRAILERLTKEEVDLSDGHGYTALQVCAGSCAPRGFALAALLLEAGADPLKHEDNDCAWTIARHNVEMRALMRPYLSSMADAIEEDVKSEPEDEYESAEEE